MTPPPPGPPGLGRGVVVRPGAPVPPPWRDAPAVTVDEATVSDAALAARAVDRLHEAWARRQPVAVVLEVANNRFRQPVSLSVEPWTVGARFEPVLDRLYFLVWANTYDARSDGEPVWWWARKAQRCGAVPVPDGPGDVTLPDGRRAWVDGGPRQPLDPDPLGAAVVHRETVELGRLTPAPGPAAPTADLAPDQLAAVAHRSGPARVIAPAGSGKTRVLTERLRHLVVDRGVERETVLAVAYNVRARQELDRRCADFSPRVLGLNQLGYRIVAEARGGRPGTLDNPDVRRILDGLLPRRRHRANTDPTAPYLDALSAVRLGLRDPAEVEADRDDVPGLALAFPLYRAALASARAVDFDEQIYAAVEALLADGGLRARWQAGCRHLLVDEFQDLTPCHVLLLRLLALPGLEVFGVGDDDQVIYSYNSADPGFLIHFADLFPTATPHPLEVNYRCPVAVVEGARTLLSYNRHRVAKEIRPGPDADRSPEALVVRRDPPEDGAVALVGVVESWLAEPGVTPASVAVLTRVNSLLLAPHVALRRAGIPLASILDPRILGRTGVRAALAYLRIGSNPDRIAGGDVTEVLRRPSRGLPPWFDKWLNGTFTLARLRAIPDRIDDQKVGDKVHGLVDDLEAVVAAVRGGTTRTALAAVRDTVGLGQAMELLDGSKGGQGDSQLDDLDALAQVASLHPDPATFGEWLEAECTREATEGGVTVSTIFKVKGMEWDRVVVFGVSSGVMPHRLAEDEEEERRVLHVGLTRGRHRVVLMADASRPSPFLDELGGTAPRDGPRPRPRLRSPAGAPPTAAPPTSPLGPEAQRAEEALRAWRGERHRGDGVPAYVVASNATLAAIARRMPTTLVELAAVPGIGPTKLELYGEEILAVLEGLR